jgi:Xaa-Pro aminopeptidase
MDTHFSAEFYVGNRARLRELFTGTAPIVLTATGLLQRGGDATFPFHQDANFWYLTGIDEPDMILVMDKDKEYLITPSVSDFHDVFNGRLDTDYLRQRSGVGTVLNAKDGWKQLNSRIKKVKHVATLSASPPYIEAYGMYVNPARSALIRKMIDVNPTLKLLDLRPHLARLRMIKQPVELEVMQQAIDLTAETIRRVKNKLPGLKYEFEVEAEITGHLLRRGVIDAWKPIVASGANACTVHYCDNSSELAAKGLILIDIGAEVEHYCSDVSRTLSIDGHHSRRSQAAFDAVLKTQNFAINLQQPGSLIRENEKKTETFMGECLRELGLIKTIDSKAIRRFFPYATSHFLGLDPHDAGDYERPLEPGMVLTVEPGIHIPEEGLGVRIEDDIVITDKGPQNMSVKLPREL